MRTPRWSSHKWGPNRGAGQAVAGRDQWSFGCRVRPVACLPLPSVADARTGHRDFERRTRPGGALCNGTRRPFLHGPPGPPRRRCHRHWGVDTGSSTSAGNNVGGSDALGTMLATSWGMRPSATPKLWRQPSALAATCVLESGCQNVGGSGSIAGAFQMTSATYTAMIKRPG